MIAGAAQAFRFIVDDLERGNVVISDFVAVDDSHSVRYDGGALPDRRSIRARFGCRRRIGSQLLRSASRGRRTCHRGERSRRSWHELLARFCGTGRNRRGSPGSSIARRARIFIAALGRDPCPFAELACATFGEAQLDECVGVCCRACERSRQFVQVLVLAGCKAHHTPTGHAPVPRGENGQYLHVIRLGLGRKNLSLNIRSTRAWNRPTNFSASSRE